LVVKRFEKVIRLVYQLLYPLTGRILGLPRKQRTNHSERQRRGEPGNANPDQSARYVSVALRLGLAVGGVNLGFLLRLRQTGLTPLAGKRIR
jgi:hypothetical protein